jgi:ubiquinone/menaquinone biosynthesis C-methylase UbiE/alpha-beta hydrolase superfamily lysophospholipase
VARIEANLSLNGAAWVGVAPDISRGGVYMAFDEAVAATENQPIQLGLVTEAGALVLGGRVRGLREMSIQRITVAKEPALGLAVEFEELDTVKEKILSSLLEGLREQSIAVKLMGRLTPLETGDLLLEIRSAGTDVPPQVAIHPCPPEERRSSLPERRLVPRVNLAIPVHLETDESPLMNGRDGALTANLSVSGACLRFKGQPNLLGNRLALRLSLPKVVVSRSLHKPVDASECVVTGEVVWTAPDTSESREFSKNCLIRRLCMGVRFVSYEKEGLRRIAEVIDHVLTTAEHSDERTRTTRIASSQVECRNAAGQRILAYHDRPMRTPPDTPVVIISPGYGETKKEYVTMAYYLAANGFHVLRYDHTNHVGESEGDIVGVRLTGMMQDLSAVLDFAEHAWPASPMTVIASSLAGRVALKLASKDSRVKLLVLITGVVDLQATLLAVHQEDLIVTFLRGDRRGVTNVLGFNVELDRFLEDAIKEGYADLRTTIRDAKRVDASVVLFAAEHDAWVQLKSVKEVQAVFRDDSARLYLIPEALHRLHENPRKARAVFRQLVMCCLEYFGSASFSGRGEILEPTQREIGLQNRLERERARAQHQMAKAEHIEFWRDYLDHFQYIVNFSDYWHLLDHIYRLMGTLDGGGRILDAGCGNGNFGMFLMINQAYRQRHTSTGVPGALHYVGMDFVNSALKQAKQNLSDVAAESQGKSDNAIASGAAITSSFCRADLNMRLPFGDNQFDWVVCNLVIGYLEDPSFTLGEFLRVLAPKGKLVVTNLKPNADLSQIYRNFVRQTDRVEEVEEAKQLLNNSGKIKQAESNGIFRFFDRQELAMVLISIGAVQPRIYSTFANQAYIAVAEKRQEVIVHSGIGRDLPIAIP